MSLQHFILEELSHPDVRSFSILEEHQDAFNNRILLPDPSPQLLINFGAPLIWEMENGSQVELSDAILVRSQTTPLKIYVTGSCRFIGITLQACEPRLLVEERIDLTGKPIIPLEGIWQDLTRLLEATFRRRGALETLATLEQFIGERHQYQLQEISSIRAAVDLLYRTKGQCSVNRLAANGHLSISQLERRLKYFTGLSPKTLARLIRFDTACSGLLSSRRLTDLAYTMGYMDQSHFIHECRALSGRTPREVKNYIHGLASNAEFLQFS